MQQLIKQIERWAEERNLIEGSTPQKQFLKLAEEIGELITGHNKQNLELIKDAVGDCFVVLAILSKQTGYLDLEGDYWEASECKEAPVALYKQNENYSLQHILSNQGILAMQLLDQEKAGSEEEIYYCLGLITYNLVHYSYGQGLDFKDCVQHAYDQIKDRKGKMVDGVFVKEEDL